MATTLDTQANHQESEDEDEETYHFTVEVEDNREPQPSVADVFIFNFVKVIHYWITAGVVILLLGGLLALVGIV